MAPRIKAFVCSFVVYVLPIRSDFYHRWWYQELLHPRPDLWMDSPFLTWVWLAYLLWTLVLQLLLYLALTAVFRRRRGWLAPPLALLLLFWLGTLPLTIVAVYLDARVVPFFYRQADGPPIDWRESCRVVHAHLLVSAESRCTSLEAAGRAWLRDHATKAAVALEGDRCRVLSFEGEENQAELVEAFGPHESQFSDESRFSFRYEWFQKDLPSYQGYIWSNTSGTQFSPISLTIPHSGRGLYRLDALHMRKIPCEPGEQCPVQASDSDALADLADEWTVRVESDRVKTSVDISQVGPGPVKLLDLSAARRTLLMLRGREKFVTASGSPDLEARGLSYEYVAANFDGEILWRLPRSGDSREGRLIVDGADWVFWKRWAEPWKTCCTIEWNLVGKRGQHQLARGRSVISVSLSPGGRLLGISASDIYKTGHTPDTVYVIRTSDGKEVFRRKLPAFAYSDVQFLGASRFAYTDFDGSDGFVRVVQVPESAVR